MEQNKDQSGAAVRGEAVAESELIELLRSIRPNYGAVGSRDIDVTAIRKKIDAAITILSARAADAPSEPSESYAMWALRQISQLKAEEGGTAVFMAKRALERADDALDSQPTEQSAELESLGEEVARLQNALCFWLPSVTEREDEVALRILEDAFLLVGTDGNLPPDFKSAQELGWIALQQAISQPSERERALEDAAKWVDVVAKDWFDAEDFRKSYAGEYLAKGIRELASSRPASSQPTDGGVRNGS